MDLASINFSVFILKAEFHAILIHTICLRRQKDHGRWYTHVARGMQ